MLNRSFSRRIGKSLSDLQKQLLDNMLPQHLFTIEKLNEKLKIFAHDRTDQANNKLFLEIGFGMGEHFVHQAKLNPDSIFIGAEVYLNGVANVLKLASQNNISNFLLWPDDLDLILNEMPECSLSGIYILFPDPWPKRKQHKKRILNKKRLEILRSKLAIGGLINFASDIDDYFDKTKELIEQDGNFEVINSNFTPHDTYIMTKYHHKALSEGRNARFLQCKLKS